MAVSRATPLVILLLATLALAANVARDGHKDIGGNHLTDAQEEAMEEAMEDAALEARIERTHGVLGSLAFVAFFPLGAIVLRTIPGRLSLLLHVAFQILGLTLALVTLALGIWMAWEKPYMSTYHAIIGMFVIAAICFQPLTGWVHHLFYKKTGGRTIVSHVHVGWGMLIITLGIINGGFGLELNGAEKKYMIVYGVFAGLVWIVWMGVSFIARFMGGFNRGAQQAPGLHEAKRSNEMRESTSV